MMRLKVNAWNSLRKGKRKLRRNLDGRISLSADILRNDESYILDDYLCLSAHFIDKNWKVKKLVLCYRSLFNSGSSEDEDRGIYRCLEDWGFETKISTLTVTDERVCENSHPRKEGKLFCVYCCEEIINKMVHDAFLEIEEVIFKFRRLMSFNFVYPLWYLANSKLEEALDWRSKGEFSPENGIDPKDVPSPEEWKEVEVVHKIVESIYEVSYELFEAKNLTANVYLYHLSLVNVIPSRIQKSFPSIRKLITARHVSTSEVNHNATHVNIRSQCPRLVLCGCACGRKLQKEYEVVCCE
ncbi:hypothetical protein EV1_021419 [Malus domestica]